MSDDSDRIEKSVSGESLSPKRMTVATEKGDIVVGADASPLDLLLTSLAGCINSTGHQVARDMDLALDELEVTVSGAYDPAAYLGEDRSKRAGFESLEVDIGVETDADRETLDAWLEDVERRCPVSDNLENGTALSLRIE